MGGLDCHPCYKRILPTVRWALNSMTLHKVTERPKWAWHFHTRELVNREESWLQDRNSYSPTSGTQSWGLQDSFSSGFSWGSQRLLRVMSSDRQRTSRTRKPPWQLLEHWGQKEKGRFLGSPLAQHTGEGQYHTISNISRRRQNNQNPMQLSTSFNTHQLVASYVPSILHPCPLLE